MSKFDLTTLIGQSVTEIGDTYIKLSSGLTLYLQGDNGDCCGYAEFDIDATGFDLEDNVITAVSPEVIDTEFSGIGSFAIGIFSNDTRISIQGETGSGSGWDYGQFVKLIVTTELLGS